MSFIIRMSVCADPNENMANSFSYIGKVREKAEKSFDSFFPRHQLDKWNVPKTRTHFIK